jgi:hypothetical protein
MLKSVNSPQDLETTHNEKKIGFLGIALRKSKEAQHYVNLGEALKNRICSHSDAEELLDIKEILVPLCEAAGISTKARSYLDQNELRELIKDFFVEFIYPLGASYHDDLVSRYLLTLGDALGGRMRNIIGNMASEKLTEKIIAALEISDRNFIFLEKKSKNWIQGDLYTIDSLPDIKGLQWKNDVGVRTLLYDTTVPIVRKNIDMVLLNRDCTKLSQEKLKVCLNDVNNYELLGELKGGIDPAGADEHWKTAGTALNRIRQSFSENNRQVKTLFIGAAIEKAMAEEMFNETSNGTLTKCANLTKSAQITEICSWITDL